MDRDSLEIESKALDPLDKTDAGAADTVEVEAEVLQDDAEEFAYKLMKRAASLNAVKIDRASFLRTELKKKCPEIDADEAIATTPVEAGIAPRELDEIALSVIDFETKKCAGLSFAAGLPGGITMAGTVPADLAQYFAHVMRVEQKLAYLYGWQSFLNDDDEVDDETLMKLIVLMGVMLGVGEVANTVTKFATEVAQKSIAKSIERAALTKTFFYTPMKKVLRMIGINVTKQTFAKGVSRVVPIVGGAVSGAVTYASFKPGAEKLRVYLRGLPTSGIDIEVCPDVQVYRAEQKEEAKRKAIADGKRLAAEAGAAAGDAVDAAGQVVSKTAESIKAGAARAANQAVGKAAGKLGSMFSGIADSARKKAGE